MVLRNTYFNTYLNTYLMARRRSDQEHIRKITRSGDSYALTIPIAVMRKLGWQEKQKVSVEKRGKGISIKDFE